MDDDAFEALIVTLAIACDNRPDRAWQVKQQFLRTIRAGHINVDMETVRDDVSLSLNGRPMHGYITSCNIQYGEPLMHNGSYDYSPPRRADPGIKLTLELSCREV